MGVSGNGLTAGWFGLICDGFWNVGCRIWCFGRVVVFGGGVLRFWWLDFGFPWVGRRVVWWVVWLRRLLGVVGLLAVLGGGFLVLRPLVGGLAVMRDFGVCWVF